MEVQGEIMEVQEESVVIDFAIFNRPFFLAKWSLINFISRPKSPSEKLKYLMFQFLEKCSLFKRETWSTILFFFSHLTETTNLFLHKIMLNSW